MGMAASQARLLSITARLTDNEQTGQALSYTKQRLADETEQINAEYLEALESTKLTVLTGFNGSIPNYTDISYNLMTGYNTVACGRQYVVANAKGQILVTKAQKDAFELGNGDFNKFLEKLGYSQADFAPSATAEEKEQQIHDAWDKYFNSVGIEHEQDPNYDNTVYSFGWNSKGYPTLTATKTNSMDIPIFSGTVTYEDKEYTLVPVVNPYTGVANTSTYTYTKIAYQDGDQYNEDIKNGADSSTVQYINPEYTMKTETVPESTYISPQYYLVDSNGNYAKNSSGNTVIVYSKPHLAISTGTLYTKVVNGQTYFYNDLYGIKDSATVSSPDNLSIIQFADDSLPSLGGYETLTTAKKIEKPVPINFEGISNEQRELYDYAVALTEAYYAADTNLKTPTDDPENANYIAYLRNIFNQMALFGYYTENDESTTIKDNNWFEQQLREGKLYLKYFSATENTFIQTTISEDDTIQEVEDDRKIALAETKYTQDTAAIEKKDQKIDLELKKLDSEHSALKTEYDSVQTVLKKNVEKSFNMFS